MTIQLIHINRCGNATYRTDGRLFEHKMAVTTKMIKEANPYFNGSLADAKFTTHLEPTIAKFHVLKTRSI